MPMIIAGIGTALPPHTIAQSDASAITQRFSCATADQERLFHTFYRRAGVQTRHCVVLEKSEGDLSERQSFYDTAAPTTLERMRRYELEAPRLAVSASQRALEDAGLASGRITHLITVSCTGFSAPGFDIQLIKQLNLRRDVARTHVGFMGCHGALNGLRAAKAYIEADPAARALICAVELCSLHHHYGWDAGQVVANALFADGAAAVVGVAAGSGPAHDPLRVVMCGSFLVDDSEDAMSWRIGDQGFAMTLAARVPDLIGGHLRGWLESWLERRGLGPDDIGSWAVHPGGPRVLSAVSEALALPRSALEVSHQVLAELGNMSSPTILFILDRLRRAHAPRPCVAIGFGPGLAIEAALLT